MEFRGITRFHSDGSGSGAVKLHLFYMDIGKDKIKKPGRLTTIFFAT